MLNRSEIMMDLPNLTGSEKQVTWANDIRDRIIKDFEDQMKKFEEHCEKQPYRFFDFSVVNRLTEYGFKGDVGIKSYVKAQAEVLSYLRENGRHPLQIREKTNKEDYTEYNLLMKERVEGIFDTMLKEATTAKWWIDRR